MSSTEEDILLSLAEKYMGEEGLMYVSSFFNQRGLFDTQILLLGVIDQAWHRGRMTPTDAKKDYELLGLDQETVIEVRQRRAQKAKGFGAGIF